MKRGLWGVAALLATMVAPAVIGVSEAAAPVAGPRPAAPAKSEATFVSPALERAAQGMEKGDSLSLDVVVSFTTRPRATGSYAVADVEATRASVLAAMPAGSYEVVSAFARIPAVSLKVDAAGLEALRANPYVRSVNADQRVRTTMADANALTGVGAVHTGGITGDGVTVAIIDTGVDSNTGVVHPALADDLAGQACFRTENDCIGGASSAEDQDGHGTHVAGIITGPEGAAPDATFYALKVFTTGDTSDTNILNALDHVISLNTTTPGTVDLINMSLGGDNFADQASCDANSTAYVTAFSTLNAQGVTIFVATGNDAQTDEIGSPGCVTGAVGVGSVGDATFTASFSSCTDNAEADKVSCFSNATPVQGAGELVDILAPGCSIVSTGLDGATDFEICGTSMATPYAAGSAALLLEYLADHAMTMTPAQVEAHMEATGVQVSDYRMAVGSPTFPRVSPPAIIGSLALDAPANFTITSTSATNVVSEWDAVGAATEYRVYRSADGAPPVLAGTVAAPTLTLDDAAPVCGELTYFVKAFDGSFESLASNTDVTTARPCPLTPSTPTIVDGNDTNFDVSWTDSNPDETSMILQRQLNGGGFSTLATLPGGTTFSFSQSSMACGIYEYRVVAERDGDLSAPSDSVERPVCAPANDDIANAEAVTADVPYTDTEPNQSYGSEEPTDPIYSCHFGAPGPGFQGVWYSITPSVDTRVTVSTASTDIVAPSAGVPDTLAAIFTGTPGNLSEVACNDDISGSNFRSSVSANADAGTTYYVFVSQWVDLPIGTSGNLVTAFTWSAPLVIPDNDLVENARVVDSANYTSTVTSAQNATTSPSDLPHSCAWNSSGTGIVPRVGTHTLWWTYTPTVDGELDVDTLSSSGTFTDTIMTVYTGTSGAFTEVACNDDEESAGVSLRSEVLDLPVTAGTTYTIYVSRWSNTPTASVGTVVLDATFTPAPAVVVSPTSVDVTEGGATDTYDVALATAPTADVDIAVAGDADCSVSDAALTFTSANWNTPQTVTVTAVDDLLAEGTHSCTIGHAATSGDAAYNGIGVASVTGTITDHVVPAAVSVTRSTPAAQDEPGGTFTFTTTIHNDSAVALTITAIGETGTTGGTCAALVSTSLAADDSAPGGADEATCISTVTHTDAGTYPAEITVDVSNAYATVDSASTSQDAVVNDVQPTGDVTVTITASPSTVPATGGPVTYTITVDNQSPEDVTLDEVSFTTSPGVTDTLSAVNCPDAIGSTIAAGTTFECTLVVNRSGTAGEALVTHVNVTVSDDEGNEESASNSAAVSFAAEESTTTTRGGGQIPATGGSVAPILQLAAVFVLAGLVLVARRRPRTGRA